MCTTFTLLQITNNDGSTCTLPIIRLLYLQIQILSMPGTQFRAGWKHVVGEQKEKMV